MWLTITLFVLMFMGFLAWLSISTVAEINGIENSCKKVDMEYYRMMDTHFCTDKEGNAHYVKLDCEWIKWTEYDCVPILLSIGEVRIK